MAATFARGAGGLLLLTVWGSAGIFGAYIVAFYLSPAADGAAQSTWNQILPDLYRERAPAGNAAMGLHFAMGAILLILGPIQFIGPLRRAFPAVHRFFGRVYIAAAVLTAIGGLVFIALRGTVGGPWMSAAFATYGGLMLICAVAAFAFARARRIERHRAWAIRLFALAIGSWLYRMEYGLWFAVFGTEAHGDDFRGPLDFVMNWMFFVPNLVVAELYLLATREGQKGPVATAVAVASGVVMLGATGLVAFATFFFVRELWGPAILASWG